MIKFPYQVLMGGWRPAVAVLLQSGEYSLKTSMLFDTGADISMIPYQFGLLLGMKPEVESISELKGIGGGIPYVLRQIQMTIGQLTFKVRIAWSMSENAPVILGRKDVFERFRITVDEKEKVTEWVVKS